MEHRDMENMPASPEDVNTESEEKEVVREEATAGDATTGNTDIKNETAEEEEEKESFGKVFWEYVRMVASIVIIVLLLQNFVYINARIPSESMQNTVMVGDRILGNRLAYRFGEPERYDIVIFRFPDDESKLFIKRVIGMPGDTITIEEDGIYINDSEEPLSEDFCPEQPDYSMMIGCTWTVPEDCYFMLGDNRNHSGDSRFWNNPFVAKKKILAKAGLRYWPLNKISLLEHGDPSYYEPEGANAE